MEDVTTMIDSYDDGAYFMTEVHKITICMLQLTEFLIYQNGWTNQK